MTSSTGERKAPWQLGAIQSISPWHMFYDVVVLINSDLDRSELSLIALRLQERVEEVVGRGERIFNMVGPHSDAGEMPRCFEQNLLRSNLLRPFSLNERDQVHPRKQHTRKLRRRSSVAGKLITRLCGGVVIYRLLWVSFRSHNPEHSLCRVIGPACARRCMFRIQGGERSVIEARSRRCLALTLTRFVPSLVIAGFQHDAALARWLRILYVIITPAPGWEKSLKATACFLRFCSHPFLATLAFRVRRSYCCGEQQWQPYKTFKSGRLGFT